MIERKSYIGKTSDGISAIWTDQHPEDATIEKEIIFYTPDEGKVFTKDGEFYDSVIIQDGVKIEDYEEVKDTRPQPGEEPEPVDMPEPDAE